MENILVVAEGLGADSEERAWKGITGIYILIASTKDKIAQTYTHTHTSAREHWWSLNEVYSIISCIVQCHFPTSDIIPELLRCCHWSDERSTAPLSSIFESVIIEKKCFKREKY